MGEPYMAILETPRTAESMSCPNGRSPRNTSRPSAYLAAQDFILAETKANSTLPDSSMLNIRHPSIQPLVNAATVLSLMARSSLVVSFRRHSLLSAIEYLCAIYPSVQTLIHRKTTCLCLQNSSSAIGATARPLSFVGQVHPY